MLCVRANACWISVGNVCNSRSMRIRRSPTTAGFRSDRSWLVNAVGDIGFAPYTAHWNVLGWPAASVPAGWHPGTGTPLAVQLAAPPGAEQLILSLAAQIEHHRPWPLVAPTR